MNENLGAIDVINIFSSASSIVLALVALWLSIYFFKQSSAEAKQSKSSAAEISASVTRLEKIFDTLYSDTFSMMRDTVTDMRQHIWTRADENAAPTVMAPKDGSQFANELSELRRDLLEKIQEASEEAGVASDKVSGLSEQVASIVDQVLAESTASRPATFNAFNPEVAIRERLRRSVGGNPVPFDRLIKFGERLGFEEEDIVNALFDLRRDGEVTWDGPESQLSSTDRVILVA